MIWINFQGLLRASYAGEASFDVKIVDPLVGGTYITLLNTCRYFQFKFLKVLSVNLSNSFLKSLREKNFNFVLFMAVGQNNLQKLWCWNFKMWSHSRWILHRNYNQLDLWNNLDESFQIDHWRTSKLSKRSLVHFDEKRKERGRNANCEISILGIKTWNIIAKIFGCFICSFSRVLRSFFVY